MKAFPNKKKKDGLQSSSCGINLMASPTVRSSDNEPLSVVSNEIENFSSAEQLSMDTLSLHSVQNEKRVTESAVNNIDMEMKKKNADAFQSDGEPAAENLPTSARPLLQVDSGKTVTRNVTSNQSHSFTDHTNRAEKYSEYFFNAPLQPPQPRQASSTAAASLPGGNQQDKVTMETPTTAAQLVMISLLYFTYLKLIFVNLANNHTFYIK